MRNLSKDKLFFSIKKVSLWFICLLSFCVDSFATGINTPPIYDAANAVIPDIVPKEDYKEDDPFDIYYRNEIKNSRLLSNYHEENYIYNGLDHSVSYYDGILTRYVCDFDSDGMAEMAIFRIRTNEASEYSTKEIYIEMIEQVGNQACKVDEIVVCAENFTAEELECSISVKQVDDIYRIFVNYFENKVLNREYQSKLMVVEFHDNFVPVLNNVMSGTDNEYYEGYESYNEVIDIGVTIRDESDLYKRCFINDDVHMIPVFTIKRINQKINDGTVEEYFNSIDYDEEKNSVRKLRYGYTHFIDRTR